MLAAGHFDGRACATLHEFPGIALEVHRRCALAGRAGAGGAVILPLKSDAVALLLVSRRGGRSFFLRQRRGACHGSYGGSNCSGQKGPSKNGLCGHIVSPNKFAVVPFTRAQLRYVAGRQLLQAASIEALSPQDRLLEVKGLPVKCS